MSLESKPLEFIDFSGGITDKVLQGDIKRAQYLDNLLIETDKKLLERDGIIAFANDGYSVPLAANQRISGFYTFINDQILVNQSDRSLFANPPGETTWEEIEGIDGHQAVQGGGIYSQTTFAEFQRQVYLTVDDGALPSKIFRDEDNEWVARTAGLPRAWATGPYTEESLLNKCILLANSLRTSFIDHMHDTVNTTYTAPSINTTSATKLHYNLDKYSLSYLETQTFTHGTDPVVPLPVPTPVPAATNEATMLALVGALNKSYTRHVPDSILGSLSDTQAVQDTLTVRFVNNTRYPLFHQAIFGRNTATSIYVNVAKGPAADLSNTTTPETVEQAAAMLDDLLQKWNWHRKAVNVHSPSNSLDQINKHEPSESAVGNSSIGDISPTIDPDYSPLFDYVNNLRFLYNGHVTNYMWTATGNITGSHKQRDNILYQEQMECILPECTNLNDMYLLIYWLRALYQEHHRDSYLGVFTIGTCDTTANNPNLLDLTPDFLVAQFNVVEFNNTSVAAQTNSYSSWSAGVESSYIAAVALSGLADSAVIDRNVIGATSNGTIQVSNSYYHSARDSSGSLIARSVSAETSDSFLSSSFYTMGTSIASWIDLASELFFALYAHAINPLTHFIDSGDPTENYDETFNFAPNTFYIPDVSTNSYAFFFSHEYTVEPNGIDYLVHGNPVLSDSQVTGISYPVGYLIPTQDADVYASQANTETAGNVISNLPVIVNTVDTNYDVDNIKLNIYKTTDGGTTYYLLAQVDNGTTEYTDYSNDTIQVGNLEPLQDQETMYTTGGIVGDDQPPISRFVHILDGTTYYAGVTDTGQYFPQRLVQSKQFAPDAAPATFFLDLPDEIVGITSNKSTLIAICDSSIYRVSGGFNTLGQGSLTYERISDSVGGVNSKSIVQTDLGVFFAGADGFYYTDGFQLVKISLEIDESYQKVISNEAQKRSIYGAYDSVNKRVWWAVSDSQAEPGNSIIYVFHANFGVKPSGVFSIQRNGLNFAPSSLVFKDDVLYIGHESGAVLKTDHDTKYDVEIDMTVAPSAWNRFYIPYRYRSLAVDMGTIFNRKWLTRVHLVGQNHGNMMIQPYAIRDLNQTQAGPKPMAPINYSVNCRWGNPVFEWGDPEFKWEYDGKMDLWRRFPSTVLRSDFMQLELAPLDGIVYSSSVEFPTGANAVVDATTKVITIQNPTGYSAIVWPDDVVNYSFTYSVDNYEQEFEIIAASGDEITVSDADNDLVNTPLGVEWEIKGFKKEQRFSLTSFVLHFALLGDENESYPGSKSNSGPGNLGGNP